MAGTQTLGNQTILAKQFYDRQLLYRAVQTLSFYAGGQMKNLGKRNGNQIEWRRFNALSLQTTALTEAVTPVGQAADITTVTGTVAQYGGYVTHSDQIDDMGFDPFVMEMMDVLGQQAGESVDAIVRAELVTGTSVLYANSTGRDQQSATYPITHDLVKKARRNLDANNARPFYGTRDDKGQGGVYMGIIHPYAFHDLYGDTTIENTFIYSDPSKLWNYSMPVVAGVAWIVTTLAPVFTGEGSGSADVYGTLIFGKDAYGVVNVAGSGKFESITKPIGSAGADDPLNQRGSIGWKSYQLPKILNNNFMTRIEAGVTA